MWTQSTLFGEAAHASHSPWPETEADSRERPASCSSSFEPFVSSVLAGSCGRTCRERSQARTGTLSDNSSKAWMRGGYGLAWRVLDAQFFGVAQRRERVFLVGSLGTMRCADVLFEREGMPWDPAPSRDKRQALAGESSGRAGNADPRAGERLTDGEIRAFYPSAGSKAGGIGFGEVSPTLKQDHNPAVSLDFHQQDARVRVSKQPDLSGTITAHAGTGGNNVPMVMCRADTQANAPTGNDLAPALLAHAKHDPPLIWPSPSKGATCSPHCARLTGANSSSTTSPSTEDG